jgi:hypothetical protein
LQNSVGRQKLRCFVERWALSCQQTRLRWPGVNRNQKFYPSKFDKILIVRMTSVKKKLVTNSIIDMISSKVPLSDKVEGEFITGKSLSETLLFAEHGENMLCTKIVLNVRNNFCTQHLISRFELGIFMY